MVFRRGLENHGFGTGTKNIWLKIPIRGWDDNSAYIPIILRSKHRHYVVWSSIPYISIYIIYIYISYISYIYIYIYIIYISYIYIYHIYIIYIYIIYISYIYIIYFSNLKLAAIGAIPLYTLTLIPMRSQWGQYNLPRNSYRHYHHSWW